MLQVKVRPRVQKSERIDKDTGQVSFRYKQSVHFVIDGEDDPVAIFQVSVPSIDGFPAGLYRFTESSFQPGKYGDPGFAPFDFLESLEPVKVASPDAKPALKTA